MKQKVLSGPKMHNSKRKRANSQKSHECIICGDNIKKVVTQLKLHY